MLGLKVPLGQPWVSLKVNLRWSTRDSGTSGLKSVRLQVSYGEDRCEKTDDPHPWPITYIPYTSTMKSGTDMNELPPTNIQQSYPYTFPVIQATCLPYQLVYHHHLKSTVYYQFTVYIHFHPSSSTYTSTIKSMICPQLSNLITSCHHCANIVSTLCVCGPLEVYLRCPTWGLPLNFWIKLWDASIK